MVRSLYRVQAKIERTIDTIESIRLMSSEFLGRNPSPFKVTGRISEDFTSYSLWAYGELSVPVGFSVLAGEVVHHLRSCFDHLAYQLVLQNNHTPKKSNQFPVCMTERQFMQARKDGRLQGISHAAKDLIEGLQPYQTKTPETATLKLIHDLDVLDKHRLLNVVAGAAKLRSEIPVTLGAVDAPQSVSKYPGPVVTGIPILPLRPVTSSGTEVFKISLGEPYPSFYAHADFTPELAIEIPGGYTWMLPALQKMLEYTRNAVEKFAAELE